MGPSSDDPKILCDQRWEINQDWNDRIYFICNDRSRRMLFPWWFWTSDRDGCSNRRIWCDHSTPAWESSGSIDGTGGYPCIICFDVYLIFIGSDLKLHTYDRLYQSIDRTENVREEAGPYNADHAGSIYRIIGGHCSHSVFQQGGIYRTAYGYFMGCDRRCLSGSVFIWSVLETHDSGSLPC